MSEQNEEKNPLDLLLEQYNTRKEEIQKQLQEASSAVYQAKILSASTKNFATKITLELQDQLNNGEEMSVVLEKLSVAFSNLTEHVTDQPLRIEKQVAGLTSSYNEIVGFENSIQQLKSQVVFEPLLEDEDLIEEDEEDEEDEDLVEEYVSEEDIVEEFVDYEEPPPPVKRKIRKTGTRPESLKKTRNSKKKSE